MRPGRRACAPGGLHLHLHGREREPVNLSVVQHSVRKEAEPLELRIASPGLRFGDLHRYHRHRPDQWPRLAVDRLVGFSAPVTAQTEVRHRVLAGDTAVSGRTEIRG